MSIIVEGPDGAGKTTLIQELQYLFPGLEVHPRFCTSTGGPIANLSEAVFKDVQARPTHFIYDRHPVVSEYVYRTCVPPAEGPSGAFLSDSMMRIRQRIARHSLMIWCLPSLTAVMTNIMDDDQMPGVRENITKIYNLYQQHRVFWPGRSVVFNYQQHDASWEGLRYALTDSHGKLWKESAAA
ncbi:thymidylate kinase [Mycobacterium phage FF47]|uniref:Thymidylate kinase n=4 Tax=Mapvirus TaxID=1920750 RepID=A0ACD4QAB5_9CAUD|nr:thymidylate kinase [Mycobacterium phage FF47]YP_010731574.1 thymidylate kinase [Mycobacterium phage Muddy]QSL99583.1 hypothetical protein [Mycobacterium phage Maco2]QXN76655.1 hypothetical protein [Mycobacterium phage Maco7]WKV22138.1 thymidylate kinase [Mycobacteroides phage 8UZL]AGI12317.1 thymidylate kinase [Mycobacterium phage FF47]WEV84093.1 thymidylate kinase [Mycobacterium phage Muddy]